MKKILVSLLSVSLLTLPVGCGGARTAVAPGVPVSPAVFEPLDESLKKPYLVLFEEAPGLEFSRPQIEKMRSYLEDAEEYCAGNFKQREDRSEEQLDSAQRELKRTTATLSDERRHEIHCRIQNLRVLKSQANMLAEQAIPVAYENKRAKLQLIEEWPEDLREIEREIRTGAHHSRKYGDPKDIGFRDVGEGQEEDVKDGEEAIERMKQSGLMPPRVENEFIQGYVQDLAERIAAKSDLRVPVKVDVLNSKEINAFALPGGFLFVERGLLEAVEDEAQLAGVLAHETAHAAARHGHRLMKKATIAGIIYQAAQVAALVLTGGAASIGTYYALQYGFYGLGLVLSLDLLGVSREFELEADQLGVQYAWNAGYDPTGFVRFFDKMATTKGYVDGLSWFRTHPPFYQRMLQSQREIMYLPGKEDFITQSSEFRRMKAELKRVVEEAKEEEEDKPSLKMPEPGCAPPDKIEYEEGQPIESICETPRRVESNPANDRTGAASTRGAS